MFRKTRLAMLGAVCSLALALSACGGGAAGSSSSANSGPSGDPVTGGTVRAVMLSEPRNLDPAILQNNLQGQGMLGNSLYGTLMYGNEQTDETMYSMAENFSTGDGGKTFVLELRDSLTFSDGTPLGSDAVKYNWDRLKDKSLGSNSTPDAALVESTEVVDGKTLKVTLTQPTPAYANQVSRTAMNWIASPAALAQGAQAFDANPIGAGPFTLKNWTRSGKIELVKNPGYWDAPRPYLDGITLTSSADEEQRLNSVVSSGADLVQAADWSVVKKASTAGFQVQSMPMAGGTFLALNTTRAPFDDVRMRQAVSAAIDLEGLELAVGKGSGIIADTLFPEENQFYTDTPLHTYDKAKAQDLFDQFAAEGHPLTFTFTAFPGQELVAQAVQAQLSQYDNVDVSVNRVDWAESGRIYGEKGYDMMVAASNFIDPEPSLFRSFYSTSPRNSSGIKDDQLDTALVAGRTGASAEDRKAAYEAVSERLAEIAPAIFYLRTSQTAIASEDVGGIQMYGEGSLLTAGLWLADQ
ncbi:ABC transporter substrate-binding protein [Rhodococcus sp. ACPA4]|uniref:ABC transporter substrate-binding protein n=1 Tax=Rhodococcus TaxID=1827 RepID=UPI0005D2DA5D|nr:MULTISPECIES: ABC transporter substrate-binding protein [unclassified Rhodococcus (in: high G+C Gram-positive bacteria)]KJF24647.1 Glutathione-binding protein gsiB precursor [Rhodococcus sp. AD45]PBC44646.1 ABC transporter substrate-binding protein [Rhodococcus sp. ACPA4]PSR43859.1 ABC transporter substrate-binding protein [Rhodococcus sp. AD45-ID]